MQLTPNEIPCRATPTADFDMVIAKAAIRDRLNIARYLESSAVLDGRSSLWKRLFCVMAKLAPHALRASGHSVQFFIPDGKHRLQVLALEDAGLAGFNLYVPDCLSQSVEGQLLVAAKESGDAAVRYGIYGANGASLQIEVLSAAGTVNAAEFFKHMLGWHRKAIRIALPAKASEVEITAAEQLCARGAATLVH